MTLAQPGPLGAFVAWLLHASFQASLLICVVLLVRRLLDQRISAQWRHALWLLVLLRLVIPWTPESRFSAYSLAPDPIPQSWASGRTAEVFPAQPSEKPADRSEPARSIRGELVVWFWLAGAAGFASWLLVQTLSTVLAFRGRRPVTEKAVLDLLEDCKGELGIQTYLAIVETPHTLAPALFGWLRPRLLLPEGVLDALSRDQLRHVFLHELSHLKRHDVALNWLMALVQVLHWFNPLLWLAFRRARADMELACDELALTRLRDHGPREYGNTIVELLSKWAEPRRLPVFAALGEDAAEAKRRIQMVAAFRRDRYSSHLFPVAVMLLLGCFFLVDARRGEPQPEGKTREQRSWATTAGHLGIADPAPVLGRIEPVGKTLPADAAMKAAADWLALFDAGDCGRTWTEMHSIVRGMISREAWTGLCEELRRAETAERGKVISRKVSQIEYLADLPMGLGAGFSVRFTSSHQTREFPGPKILLAKDRDDHWRPVRVDKD